MKGNGVSHRSASEEYEMSETSSKYGIIVAVDGSAESDAAIA
jgi:hypothetical protein